MSTSKKQLVSTFEELIQAFEAIAQEATSLRREYRLVKAAPHHGIPRSHFKRLFTLYLAEKESLPSATTGGNDE